MSAFEELRQEHHAIQRTFGMLESALRIGPEAWPVLRQLCFSALRQLQLHVWREERMLARYDDGSLERLPAYAQESHRDKMHDLKLIVHYVMGGAPAMWKDVAGALNAVIEGVRQQIEEQEALAFPLLERTVPANGTVNWIDEPPILSGTLTVRQAVSWYPAVRRACASLGVDLLAEADETLERIAWRRGLDCQELLTVLRQWASTSPELLEADANGHADLATIGSA
ncbi:MAG TPA: hemerythrin domain-containing protein [bacterium]